MSGTTTAWGMYSPGWLIDGETNATPPAKSWGIKVLISLQSHIAKEIAN